MAGNADFLVEALKNAELTPDQWVAIADACDQCPKTIGNSLFLSSQSSTFILSTPSNVERAVYTSSGSTVVPSMPHLSSSRSIISDPVVYNNLQQKLQEIQESASKDSIAFPHLDHAIKSYTNGRRDFVPSASKTAAEDPHQPANSRLPGIL
ncbi:uncharacterized protein EV420DRAFT_791084 [Desarmillaria tabescens]|uniref:Uncharacterized protein n=1 Tax=Armillaria tabescens TaxID=1929756 RepID=A0AA39JX62_ARMTA|nr:uncharacterized protein EV420DRAFT_791084 [Desarmillaria tabescens]KAK0449079.1 hypothetical protein EV420DRAFT_791084 [Desarmillaria tabescens]